MKLLSRSENWLLALALGILVVFFAACDHVYSNWQP